MRDVTEDRVQSAAKAFDPKLFFPQLGKEGTIFSCKQKQVLFSQGDCSDAVFYLQRGRIKLAVVSKHGKEAVIGLLGPTDFFGEGCVAGQPIRTATASAITECSIMRVEKAAMIRMLHDHSAISEMFVAYLLSRNLRIEEDLVDQLFNSSEMRLARALLLLARFGNEGDLVPVIPKISQQTLAEMIGTTRSRVSFFMNKFKNLGFIKNDNGLEVHSSLLNVVLHDSVHDKSRPKTRKLDSLSINNSK